ncbi:MAG: chorismate mutase [Methanomicrobiales archaeon]|nr:chorismate mutase [Methanomicrobiales archaeon]
MSLDAVRNEIQKIDEAIIDLVIERQMLAVRIAQLKQERGLPIRDEEQRRVVLDRAIAHAAGREIDPVAIQEIFEILIGMNEEQQQEYISPKKGIRG